MTSDLGGARKRGAARKNYAEIRQSAVTRWPEICVRVRVCCVVYVNSAAAAKSGISPGNWSFLALMSVPVS